VIALVSAEIGVQTKGKAKPQRCSLSVLAKHLICKKRLEFPNETLTVEGDNCLSRERKVPVRVDSSLRGTEQSVNYGTIGFRKSYSCVAMACFLLR
jgi:hypothetical protein